MEDTLRKNWEFYNEKYPKYLDLMKACSDATTKYQDKRNECVREQSLIKARYCALKSAKYTACTEYSKCYKTIAARHSTVVEDVKNLESRTKDEFRALNRIKCFIGIMIMGELPEDQDAEKKCSPKGVDTSHLDIVYPALPDQEACETEVKSKGDYSAIPCPGEEGALGGDEGADEGNALIEAKEAQAIPHRNQQQQEQRHHSRAPADGGSSDESEEFVGEVALETSELQVHADEGKAPALDGDSSPRARPKKRRHARPPQRQGK